MHRTFAFTVSLLVASPLLALTAYGQYYPLWPNEPAQRNGPRERRAQRENAVAQAGPKSRPLVEAYGEDAVAALNACSRLGIQTLIEFHASGGLDRMPQPRELLRVVARPNHGDDVIVWAAEHQSELTDPDSSQAFLNAPLEYALNLKPLAQGAEQLRATRAHDDQLRRPEFLGHANPSNVAGVASGLAIVGLLVWWRRNRRRF